MRKALSLVEVIVSMALLGVLASIVLFFALSTTQPNRLTTYREVALCLLSSDFEAAQTREVGVHNLEVVRGADGVEYHRQVEVFPVSGYTPQELKEIKVRVSWEARGRSFQVMRQRRVAHASW